MNYTEQIINELLNIIVQNTDIADQYCVNPFDCDYSFKCQECILRGIEKEIMERNK